MPGKNWIPKDMKKGALHKQLGVPEDEKIGLDRIEKEIKKLENKKDLTDSEKLLLKRLFLAKTLIKINKAKSKGTKEALNSEERSLSILEILKCVRGFREVKPNIEISVNTINEELDYR